MSSLATVGETDQINYHFALLTSAVDAAYISAAQLRCCGLRGESRSPRLHTPKQIKCSDLTGLFESSQFYLFSLKGLCNLHRILSTGNYEPVSLNSLRAARWSRTCDGDTATADERGVCGKTCLLHMLLLHGTATRLGSSGLWLYSVTLTLGKEDMLTERGHFTLRL